MPKNHELSKNVKNSNVPAPLFADETATVLTKESSEKQIKAYFEGILKLSNSDNDFPVRLNDVWMLAYTNKGDAVKALKKSFIEGIDYKVFSQNPKNPLGGRPTEIYYLSIPCLEYFIARKVRPVFEVYRQVFHKVVTGKKEVIYTESEVKNHLLDAERQVRDTIMKHTKLLGENTHLRSLYNAMAKLYEEELSYKCNLVAFLFERGLFHEWEKHYQSLK